MDGLSATIRGRTQGSREKWKNSSATIRGRTQGSRERRKNTSATIRGSTEGSRIKQDKYYFNIGNTPQAQNE